MVFNTFHWKNLREYSLQRVGNKSRFIRLESTFLCVTTTTTKHKNINKTTADNNENKTCDFI